MKRNDFIKKTSLGLTGSLIVPALSCKNGKNQEAGVPGEAADTGTAGDAVESVPAGAGANGGSRNPSTLKNWAGNYTYKAEKFHEPGTVEELRELVGSLERQKALGSRHCFNNIADSPQSQVSTRKLDAAGDPDRERMTITVGAGARYGDFATRLHEQGFALHNLASLPHITVAGACATATHGSGVGNGNLATAVVSADLVKPDGSMVRIDRSHPHFHAVVTGLGAFGIITALELEIQPAYDVRQDVFTDLPLESVVSDFDAIMSGGYSVSLFTDWMDNKVSEVWVKRRMDTAVADLGNDYFGARAATENIHPILALSAENCTEQLGVPGPWYDRLPHFKMGFTPSAGEELQSEFFVPRENAVAAMLAIEKMKADIKPHLLISEIRTVAADNFWMSPCYRRDSVAIHFTWQQKPAGVMAMIPRIESALAPFDVKPHWGKLFTIDPKVLQGRYPKYKDFLALAKSYDPDGKFTNDFLERNIY